MRVVHMSTIHTPLDVRIYHKECRALAAAGHRVHYLVANPPAAEKAGVVFHALDKPTHSFRGWRIFKRLVNVFRQARALRADVYHFHDPELIPVGILLKLTGAKVIYDVHEDAPREAISLNRGHPFEAAYKYVVWHVFESLAKLFLDAFVCATPTIARKFPRDRTITVHNFPRTEEFSMPEEPSAALAPVVRTPRIVYVGGISRIRGAREMVQAMSHLAPALQARLVLVGHFTHPELASELAQLPGWEHVDHLGPRPRHEVMEQLSQARLGLVVLHPERDHLDALPNKLFEYMAAGLPIVASDFPLWRRLLGEIGCGLVVDPLDPQAIAETVQYLLEHADEAEAMGQRGREAVQMRYNWATEAEKLLELYQNTEKR